MSIYTQRACWVRNLPFPSFAHLPAYLFARLKIQRIYLFSRVIA